MFVQSYVIMTHNILLAMYVNHGFVGDSHLVMSVLQVLWENALDQDYTRRCFHWIHINRRKHFNRLSKFHCARERDFAD